jgi:putative transcriptional regulator
MKKKTLTQTLVNAAKDLKFEKATVDKLQALNIPEVKALTAKDIKRLRAKMNASQGVFARYLNVNPSTLQKWEQGTVSPQNAALKLLNLIQKHGVNILLEETA